jgi:hypothetical protein
VTICSCRSRGVRTRPARSVFKMMSCAIGRQSTTRSGMAEAKANGASLDAYLTVPLFQFSIARLKAD